MPDDRRRRLSSGQVLLALGLMMFSTMLVVTIFGPWIASYDPSATSPDSLAGPTAAHWLGTDSIGRDVLSRLIIGGRTTLLITFVAVFFAVSSGLVLGLAKVGWRQASAGWHQTDKRS